MSSGTPDQGGGRDDRLDRYRERLGDAPPAETASWAPLQPVYTDRDLPGSPDEREERSGLPGEFPFTRGVYTSMYRGRPWTMRQYAGFSTARESNERFRYLLGKGQTGLSVAFDLPTQIGYDSDQSLSRGEVGKVGVPISTVDDFDELMADIPLDQVSVSMTINSTAICLLGFAVATAKRRGIDPAALRGTLQNDMLKEYAARGTFRFPIRPAVRIVADIIRHCSEHMPKWNPISISGYHIREAGATAAQEVAFTLANGRAYVEAALAAGLPVDAFARRLSFFFAAGLDLMEEVAKFRAARRMWAKMLRDDYGAKDEKSQLLRFHTQTMGSQLTAQQPHVNLVRVTVQALAAVLGGTQSLHTNSYDEALALPTEQSAKLALRTQQVLAHETGVTGTADPLGGSFAVEALTDRVEEDAGNILAEIDRRGGAVAAIESGFMQSSIQESAYRQQQELEAGDRVQVGVNEFVETDDAAAAPQLMRIDDSIERERARVLQRWRQARDDARHADALAALGAAAGEASAPLVPLVIDAVEAGATNGEICTVFAERFGEYADSEFY